MNHEIFDKYIYSLPKIEKRESMDFEEYIMNSSFPEDLLHEIEKYEEVLEINNCNDCCKKGGNIVYEENYYICNKCGKIVDYEMEYFDDELDYEKNTKNKFKKRILPGFHDRMKIHLLKMHKYTKNEELKKDLSMCSDLYAFCKTHNNITKKRKNINGKYICKRVLFQCGKISSYVKNESLDEIIDEFLNLNKVKIQKYDELIIPRYLFKLNNNKEKIKKIKKK